MKNKKKLGEILLELGLVSKDSLESVLTKQKSTAKKIGELLVELSLLKKAELVRALAIQCELPFVEKLPDKPNPELSKIIPMEFMERYQIVPFEMNGNRLRIATINPQSILFIDNLTLSLKMMIDLVFTRPEELDRILSSFDRSRTYFSDVQAEVKTGENKEQGALIQMVSLLLTEALKRRASDIHLESSREEFKVRYRIDGALQQSQAPAKELSPQVVSRLKVLAGLDLAEKRLPQDGRIRFNAEGHQVDLRVSIIPSLYGESVVLRILQRKNLRIGLTELGFNEEHCDMFRSMISLPYGMIFVTGPTGSGKTTTLYAALETLNQPGEKIITVEDPIEYELDGVNQVQVKPDIGLTFAQTLRAMLRQAPNIILVGEIRDLETAEIAVQAALTGHLVFSTLHTNDAMSTIPRLIDLGIKPYLVAAATQGVIAQRLVRKICEYCREVVEKDPSFEVLLQKKKVSRRYGPFYRGRGCSQCGQSGYKGRLAIFEMIAMDEDIRIAVSKEGGSLETLRKVLKNKSFQTLFQDGLIKAEKGLTSLEEVLRVVGGDEENV